MKTNPAFKKWNKPYLFKAIEEIMAMMSPEDKKDVIPLGIGDPDLQTPKAIREAIAREHHQRYYGYPTVEGRLDLREAISNYYYKRFNCNVFPNEIMVGMGAKSDLFDIPHVFAQPGDQALILDPAYPVYCDAVLFNNLDIKFLEGSPVNNYCPSVNPNQLSRHQLALIFLCYPNNPTGAMATREYIQNMIDVARYCDALIVYDIAYVDFMPGGNPKDGFSIFEIPGAEAVAIEVGSFSKPFSMTGDRISWIAAKNPDVLAYWKRFRANRDSGASNYEQAGALAALTDPDVAVEVQENMNIYKQRANILTKGLKAMKIPVYGLQNSPYAWFKSPIPDSQKATSILLRDARILLTPGIGFGPAGEGFLRATIFQPESKLKEAINRMSHFSL